MKKYFTIILMLVISCLTFVGCANIEFIRAVDIVVEGFGHPDNILYAPEIKYYSIKVIIDKKFETSVKGLYSIGDGGGMTRGLMMASCSGVQMARNL